MEGLHDQGGVQMNHYKQFTTEPIDVIHDWGLGFALGNVVKYIGRYKHKGGQEDLVKAAWYLVFALTNDKDETNRIADYINTHINGETK